MVHRLCTAAILSFGADLHADHIEDSVPFSERVYDLLRNSFGIWDVAAVYPACGTGDRAQDSVSAVCGTEFFVSGGSCVVPW